MDFSELSLLEYFYRHNSNGLLVDVGAHHGGVSIVFAQKGWQVIAFEPEEKNRTALVKNLKNFDKAKIIPKAVSDMDNARIPFYVSNLHYGIHSIKPFHETHQLAYEVDTTTLNAALLEEDIKKVTLLKIDIEGADFLALKGFDIDKYSPDIIMLEFMDDRSMKNFGYNHHNVVDYMKGKDYFFYVSEWAPIKQYGIEGVIGEPHTWLQCKKYPLDHEPSWGNLIFIKKKYHRQFKKVLDDYLKSLKDNSYSHKTLKSYIKLIPGARSFYEMTKRLYYKIYTKTNL